MRRRRRIFLAAGILAILVVLLAVLTLYLLFPRLAGEAIERSMRRAGLADVVVNTEKLKTGSARFSQISFRKDTEAGRLFVSLREIEAEFALAPLLHGEIASVRVGTLLVAWDANPANPANPAKLAPPAAGSAAFPDFPVLALPVLVLPRIQVARTELIAPGLIPGDKTELADVVLAPTASGFTLAFSGNPALLPKALWSAKKPIALGTVKLQALEQRPPEKLTIELAVTTEKDSLARIGLASPLGFELVLRTGKKSELVSLSLSRLEAEWTKAGARAKFFLKESRGKFQIRIEASGPNANGAFTVRAALEKITLAAKTNPLSSLLKTWPFAFDLEGGTFEANVGGTYNPANAAYEFQGSLSLERAVVALGEIAADGIAAYCSFQGSARAPIAAVCKEIRIATITAGVPVREIELGLSASLASPHTIVTIPRFSAKTMGGTLRAQDAKIRLGGANPAIPITVEGIDLQEVLRAKQHAEFSATGTLDGIVPLRLAPEGVYVEKGELHARGGGVIQYRPEGAAAFAASNPGLGMAVGALANFQYHELKTDLAYTPAGLLNMNVALKGKNPEFQKGQTVHFNINLEENILALFKSLTVAEGFSKQIDDRVQDAHDRSQKGKKTK